MDLLVFLVSVVTLVTVFLSEFSDPRLDDWISRALSIKSLDASLFHPKILANPLTTVHFYLPAESSYSSVVYVSIVTFFFLFGSSTGLGYSGLGYSGFGYSGLGYYGFGSSGLGYYGLGSTGTVITCGSAVQRLV